MVVGRKSLLLLICIAAMIALIVSSVGTTYAYNSIPEGEFSIGLNVTYNDGTTKNITNKSTTPLFTDSILWEPGAMHAVELTAANIGTLPFDYWFYPLVSEQNDTAHTKLAEVLDVYIYKSGCYNYDNGRPDLSSDEWLYLGKLNSLPPKSQKNADCLGTLQINAKASHTLLIHMQESADNRYQGLSLNINIKMGAVQNTTSAQG